MRQKRAIELSREEMDRIIQMAWEDRTSFDVIRSQFGLTPGEVIELMRREMKRSSFLMWRKRVSGRKTKHAKTSKSQRFRCGEQDKFKSSL